jgi:hypothetical protein
MNYVGFSTTNGLLSRLLRWITRAEVSHSFLVVELYGKAWYVGAEAQGVVMMPMEKYVKKNTIKALCEVPELNDEDLAVVMGHLGEAYDYGGLLGGIFPQIGRWFKQKWKNPWANPKALICSEFVTLALQEAGLSGAEKLDPPSVTPQDLLGFLTEHYLNQEE